jgi:hypothetical protein
LGKEKFPGSLVGLAFQNWAIGLVEGGGRVVVILLADEMGLGCGIKNKQA